MLRIPVGFSAGFGAMIAMLVGGQNLSVIPGKVISGLDSFAFLAIPAFIYAGDLMTLGGSPKL